MRSAASVNYIWLFVDALYPLAGMLQAGFDAHHRIIRGPFNFRKQVYALLPTINPWPKIRHSLAMFGLGQCSAGML
jgi:hypothetical protein